MEKIGINTVFDHVFFLGRAWFSRDPQRILLLLKIVLMLYIPQIPLNFFPNIPLRTVKRPLHFYFVLDFSVPGRVNWYYNCRIIVTLNMLLIFCRYVFGLPLSQSGLMFSAAYKFLDTLLMVVIEIQILLAKCSLLHTDILKKPEPCASYLSIQQNQLFIQINTNTIYLKKELVNFTNHWLEIEIIVQNRKMYFCLVTQVILFCWTKISLCYWNINKSCPPLSTKSWILFTGNHRN